MHAADPDNVVPEAVASPAELQSTDTSTSCEYIILKWQQYELELRSKIAINLNVNIGRLAEKGNYLALCIVCFKFHLCRRRRATHSIEVSVFHSWIHFLNFKEPWRYWPLVATPCTAKKKSKEKWKFITIAEWGAGNEREMRFGLVDRHFLNVMQRSLFKIFFRLKSSSSKTAVVSLFRFGRVRWRMPSCISLDRWTLLYGQMEAIARVSSSLFVFY